MQGRDTEFVGTVRLRRRVPAVSHVSGEAVDVTRYCFIPPFPVALTSTQASGGPGEGRRTLSSHEC
ncbi:hypothetical protein ABIE35_002868 [Paenarthrobacter sp. 4246]